VAKVAEQFDSLEAAKIMLSVIQEEFDARKKPAAGSAMALARGLLAREELKQQEGGSLSAEEARLMLGGLSKEAVLKRFRRGKLLGWREARQGAVRFPVWQFSDDNVLPGLAETLAILNQAPWMDDWGRVLFFLNARASLGKMRPLDLLRDGRTKEVLQAARTAIE
jgi:hypothetical protein